MAREKKVKKQQTARPFFEALPDRGAGWKIKPSPSLKDRTSIDLAEKVAKVPLGTNERDAVLRAHELAHARWTPDPDEYERQRRAGAVTTEALDAAECVRMNCLLTKVGVDTGEMHNGLIDVGDLSRAFKEENWRQIILQMVRMTFTGGMVYAAALLAEATPSLPEGAAMRIAYIGSSAERLADAVTRSENLFAESFNSAVWLAQLIDSQCNLDPFVKPGEVGPDDESDAVDSEEGRVRGGKHYEGDSDWGVMKMDPRHLSRSIAGRWARHRLAREEGDIPRSMYRMPTDGRVFDYRIRKKGGTVLVDGSGSMELDIEDVDEIIAAAPGATVAIYAGDGNVGYLRIIARRGMAVSRDDLTLHCGMNVIDGPALDWLGHQAEPRIWVSDGEVTGINDSQETWMETEARRICRVRGIRRVEHSTQVAPVLRSAGLQREVRK